MRVFDKEDIKNIFKDVKESNSIDGFSVFWWKTYSKASFIGSAHYLCSITNFNIEDDYLTCVNKLKATHELVYNKDFNPAIDYNNPKMRDYGRNDAQVHDMAVYLQEEWEKCNLPLNKPISWYENVIYGHMILESVEGIYVENFIESLLRDSNYDLDVSIYFTQQDLKYLDHNCGVDIISISPKENWLLVQVKPISFIIKPIKTKLDILKDINKCATEYKVKLQQFSYDKNIDIGAKVWFILYKHDRENDKWYIYQSKDRKNSCFLDYNNLFIYDENTQSYNYKYQFKDIRNNFDMIPFEIIKEKLKKE